MRATSPHGSPAVPQPNTGSVCAALVRRAAALCLTTMAAACSGGPPPPPPTTMADLQIDASSDANATETGQGAPVVVRVYQLASTAGFEQAEFFRLMNADTATLGTDLVKKEEYLLAPGTKKTAMMPIPDRVSAIGVFAAYREFQSKTWRVTVPVPPHKTTPVHIEATGAGLRVLP